MGGYDVIFPETVTPTDHQGNKLVAPARIVDGSWRIEMKGVTARKRRMVDGLREMHLAKFAKSGTEIVRGSGRFVGERTLEVSLVGGGVRVLRGKQVFLDVGTRAEIEATNH